MRPKIKVCIVLFVWRFLGVECDLYDSGDREFSCKEKLSNMATNSTALIINGPPREDLNENWRNFRINDEERSQTRELIINNCDVKHVEVLGDLNRFTELTIISITDVGLMEFDIENVVNNVRLNTLILDDNPIRALKGDAQLSLEHLSLQNTSMERLPNASLDIMKQLKTLNVTGDHFKAGHEEACASFVRLEMFNGESCPREQSKGGSMVDTEVKPIIKDSSADDTDNSGTHLRPNILAILMPFVLGPMMFSRKWMFLLIIVCSLNFGNTAKLFDPLQIANETDLHLESRGIAALDDYEFTALSSLTHLHLGNNNLRRLNIRSETLTYLEVSGNNLESVQDEIIKHMPNLRKLILSDNRIQEVNWNLDWSPYLVEVNLSKNELLRSVQINSEILEVLSLAFNHIDVVELNTPALTLLDLRYTTIGNMDQIVEDVCRKHSGLSFRISYISKNGTSDFYKCQATAVTSPPEVDLRMMGKPSGTNCKGLPDTPRKLVGCEYNTLRIHMDDVVFTRDEYFWLNAALAAMCACVLLMSATLVCLSIQWYKNSFRQQRNILIV